MNWKQFITAFVSSLLMALPMNGIPCGDTENPQDYFTSFFSKSSSGETYYPFYYTSLLQFYDQGWYWGSQADSLEHVNPKIVDEWMAYGNAGKADVIRLVYKSAATEVQQLAANYKAGKPVAATLAKNTLAISLVNNKRTEAINYLLFAKRMEKVSDGYGWKEVLRDSVTLNRFINEATAAMNTSADAFIKQKYAYQKCKLAFYNHRYDDCIRWYNEHFESSTSSAVKELALSYKAGSYFRKGENKEAAYYFSIVFPMSDKFKKSNFLGFYWATNFCDSSLISDYTSLCRNNKEKAVMLGMFSMYGTAYRLELLKEVYALDPSSPLLPLLATREVNKLEEQYFTPALYKQKGGRQPYLNWNYTASDQKAEAEVHESGKRQAEATAIFLDQVLREKRTANSMFYGNAAAYLHFMNKNYDAARELLTRVNNANDPHLTDQSKLISLLIAAHSAGQIDAAKEAELLPAMQWLVQKAGDNAEYMIFCRNFFTEVLAQQYEQQGHIHKAALAYAMVATSFNNKQELYYSYVQPLNYVQDEMSTAQVLKLYEVMTAPATETEKFLVAKGSLKRDDVIDVLGTSYLRDRNYTKAIEWLGKAARTEKLEEEIYNYRSQRWIRFNSDPFHDYLNDWQRFDKTVAVPYTKLTLAKKLQELKKQVDTAKSANRSKLYYRYASALYNMSYYGNSWNAVAYDRSGADWNEGNHKQAWEKEYYGVYEAKNYYQTAYETATDREFKAACLFMVAKCLQRQLPRPQYDYDDYNAYRQRELDYEAHFTRSPLFGKFKAEFGTTKFYRYAYNRCSYLRDFVEGK